MGAAGAGRGSTRTRLAARGAVEGGGTMRVRTRRSNCVGWMRRSRELDEIGWSSAPRFDCIEGRDMPETLSAHNQRPATLLLLPVHSLSPAVHYKPHARERASD